MSIANKQFLFSAEAVNTTIPFNPEWHNGTGYFDALVYERIEGLENGDRFITKDQNGRKIIGVVTPFGNVLVFQRYCNDEDTPIVNNVPAELRYVIRSGSMSPDAVLAAIGGFSFDINIGKLLDLAVKMGKGEYTPKIADME